MSTTSLGFYWTHNFMLTKRWRSAATGDSEAVNKLMNDLEEFCADKDGALEEFWDSYKGDAACAIERVVKDKKEEEVEETCNQQGVITLCMEGEVSQTATLTEKISPV